MLMVLYERGESGAFDELYSRHSSRVYGYLKRKLHGPGEAEDLLQQTFMKLHQSRGSYDATLPFLPWLFSITRHLLTDHFRKRRAVPLEEAKLHALADASRAREGEAAEPPRWEEILGLLPDEQRELVRMRYEEGISYEEIARRNDINEVSARKRLSRAVLTLRNRFSGKGVKP